MSCTSKDSVKRLGEKLYETCMDGCDAELGDTEGFGWYGLLLHTDLKCVPYAIVREDSQGAVNVAYYGAGGKDQALMDWAEIAADYEEWEAEAESEDQ